MEREDMDKYEEEWKKLLAEVKSELQTSISNTHETLSAEITRVEQTCNANTTSITTLQGDLKQTKTTLKTTQLQLTQVTGLVIRQSQELIECKEEIEVLKNRLDSNVLIIQGLIESENENCTQLVKEFLKDKVKVTKEIEIQDAFRLGKKSEKYERTMKVFLANPRDKRHIYANTKNLKDVVNDNDRPFYVKDRLTARKKAKKDRERHLLNANKAMDTKDQLVMKMENQELLVNGQKYQKQVRPPSCKEILCASKDTRLARLNMKAKRGPTVNVDNQEFIGYCATVKSIQDVNLAYGKIRAIHADARHVVSAVRLPSRNFHTHQDFYDDDEHNAGQFLLQLLESSDIMNRAIFVVRYYDGTHIGKRRYSAMRDAVASALDLVAFNEVTNKYDTIWISNDAIGGSYKFNFGKVHVRGGLNGRGRGRGRGGFGNPGNSLQNKEIEYRNPLQEKDNDHTWAEVAGGGTQVPAS